MFCLKFFIVWIFNDLKNKNFCERKIRSIESQSNSHDDKNCSAKPSNSLLYRFIEIWAYFESLILALVLIKKVNEKNEFHDNFLHGFCFYTHNKNIITFAIVYKVVASLALAIRCRTVRFRFYCLPMEIIWSFFRELISWLYHGS